MNGTRAVDVKEEMVKRNALRSGYICLKLGKKRETKGKMKTIKISLNKNYNENYLDNYLYTSEKSNMKYKLDCSVFERSPKKFINFYIFLSAK